MEKLIGRYRQLDKYDFAEEVFLQNASAKKSSDGKKRFVERDFEGIHNAPDAESAEKLLEGEHNAFPGEGSPVRKVDNLNKERLLLESIVSHINEAVDDFE